MDPPPLMKLAGPVQKEPPMATNNSVDKQAHSGVRTFMGIMQSGVTDTMRSDQFRVLSILYGLSDDHPGGIPFQRVVEKSGMLPRRVFNCIASLGADGWTITQKLVE